MKTKTFQATHNKDFKMIEKPFFMEQLKLYFDDSDLEEPKYITRVKDIDFEDTKIFLKTILS